MMRPARDCFEMGYGVLRHQVGTAQVDPDNPVPVLGWHALGIPDDVNAGVVHHDVETAELRHGSVDRGLYLIFVRHVGLDEDAVSAEFLDFLHGGRTRVLLVILASLGLLPNVRNRDPRAFAGEFEADAARRCQNCRL